MENKQVLTEYEVKREQQRVKLSLQKSTQKLINKVGIVAASAIIGALAEHITIDENSVNLGDVSGFQKGKELASSGEKMVCFTSGCKNAINVGWFLRHIGEYEFDAVLCGQYRSGGIVCFDSEYQEEEIRKRCHVGWNAHGCNKYGVYLDKKVEIEGWDKLIIHVTNN